jgi:hypothetical protein
MFCLLPLPSNTETINPDNKREIKIFIIQSYSIGYFCSEPQLIGLKKGLSNLDYKFRIRAYYMNSKGKGFKYTKNEALKVMNRIKEFQPDIIVTMDDNAFRFVAIPYLIGKYPVIFSGLNKELSAYEKQFPEVDFSKVAGVQEITRLWKLKRILGDSYIEDFIILKDNTPTSRYLTQNYINQLKYYKVIKVTNVTELKKTIMELNKRHPAVLLITVQSLPDGMNRLEKPELIQLIAKYNKKHLTVTGNLEGVRKGAAIAISPDFYTMGEQAADLVKTYLEKGVLLREDSETYLVVNKKMLYQLRFDWIYKEFLDYIDKVY